MEVRPPMKKCISTDKAPAAIGPYSQAVQSNGFLFVSGQIPLVPETGQMCEGRIGDQTHQCLKNLSAVLESVHSSLKDVVKVTIFMVDLSDFGIVNDIYSSYFSEEFPARSTVQVAALPKGALIEIEAIACVG